MSIPVWAGMLVFAMTACAVDARAAEGAQDDDIGGPFNLVNHDGKPVSDRTYLGNPVLLYFGFTSCPEICPTDLARMALIAKAIRADTGSPVTPVFVTIDPDTDTAERIGAYVKYFDKDFVGLTGSAAQIKAVASEYHVYYKRVPLSAGSYTMDHSTFLFLLGADGKYLDHYGRSVPAADVVTRALARLKPAKQQRPGKR